jgi:3'(2'), 5'-bisphosphate nucleotidase
VPTPALPAPSDDDLAVAAALASGAGEVLVALRDTARDLPSSELKDAGDAAAQAWLAAALAAARPDDAVLSEEAADDISRVEADRVWIIDPLDGTREFSERAGEGWRDDFAVHIALWQRDHGLTHAAVSLPARGVVHTTSAGDAAGALAASVQEVLDGVRPLRLAISRSRPPRVVHLMAEEAGVEVVPMGSAGVKTVSVLDGTTDAYVHAGGQYEWDSAAPVAVVQSAGFVATRLDGSQLEYNRPNPWLPDLVVCHPALEAHLRALIGRATAREGLDA